MEISSIFEAFLESTSFKCRSYARARAGLVDRQNDLADGTTVLVLKSCQ